MTNEEGNAAKILQSYLASSSCENEDASNPPTLPTMGASHEQWVEMPALSTAELIQLRVRVIALENLVIALLAAASQEQRESAAAMAAFISPRPGFTPHPVTLHAAEQMVSLINRSLRFVR